MQTRWVDERVVVNEDRRGRDSVVATLIVTATKQVNNANLKSITSGSLTAANKWRVVQAGASVLREPYPFIPGIL